MIPTAERLDELFRTGTLKRLGIGVRRACYELPGTGLCVKCYRSEDEIALGKHVGYEPFKPLKGAVVREIRRNRFSDVGNTSCQEWRYYQSLKRRLPPELMAVFPRTLERVLVPSRGWCLVEERVTNADGTSVRALHQAWLAAPKEMRSQLLSRLEMLTAGLIRHAVRFYDPHNILVQTGEDGDVRLRITDFEPASRTFVSLDRLAPALVRLKLRRRFSRYRNLFGMTRVCEGDAHE